MNADLRTGRPIQWGSVNKPSSFYKKAYRAHKYLRYIDHVLSSLTYSLLRLITHSSGPFPSASIEDSTGRMAKFIYSSNVTKSIRVRDNLHKGVDTHYAMTYDYKYDLVLQSRHKVDKASLLPAYLA